MDIQATVNLDGLDRRFANLAAAASDPSAALLRCGGAVRSASKAIFAAEGPGWPKLSEETLRRKITAPEIQFYRTNRHGGSISRDVGRLVKQLQRAHASLAAAKTDKQREKRGALLESRQRQAREFERMFKSARLSSFAAMAMYAEREAARRKKHAESLKAARALDLAPGESIGTRRFVDAKGRERVAKFVKNQSKERRRLMRAGSTRYRMQAGAERVLGNLSQSLSIRLEGRTVRIFSHARIGAIHNAGGVAGHGAKIPARPYMYLTPALVATFRQIVLEQLYGAMAA